MSNKDYIGRKGRVVYPKIFKDKSFIDIMLKKELESLSKILAKKVKKNQPVSQYPPRILQEKKVKKAKII